MNKLLFLTVAVLSVFTYSALPVSADQNNGHAEEIERGRTLVESKVNCDALNDEQLESIGDYIMEQRHPGKSHDAMHEMMGMKEGTAYHQQFHVDLARMMYCGTSAPTNTQGMMPMMGGMIGSRMMSAWPSLMMGGFRTPYRWFGWMFMILFWLLVIVGIVALIRWIFLQQGSNKEEKSAIAILKERYARGEIDKNEYEEKKKDIR